MQDFRLALRCLTRQPAFTLVITLTLALGIGANTAIFSLLRATLLKPLPFPEADRLVFVWNSYPKTGLPQAAVSIPDYLDRRHGAEALAEATLFRPVNLNLADGGRPEQVRGLAVTPSFFATFARSPAIGRAFVDADATPGADHYAILTEPLWRSRFGGDPSVVGRAIRLDGEAHSVVGVLPADFDLPSQGVDVLVPFSFTSAQMSDAARGNEFSAMVGRLAPGATLDQLDAQMAAIVARNLERLPARRTFAEASGFTGRGVPYREQLFGDLRLPLLVLQAGALLLLIIACANVANLLLMRATDRQREFTVRRALGAERWRLARQVLAEAMTLALTGGLLGVAVGVVGVRGLVALQPDRIQGLSGLALDPVVLALSLALVTSTGLAFSVGPVLGVGRMDAFGPLREDGLRASADRRSGRVRRGLVVTEVALAVILLLGAGLLTRSYIRLMRVDPGFASENVLTAQLALPSARYPDPNARRAFWTRLVTGVRALPGVTVAGLTSNVPFNGQVSSGSYRIVGWDPGPTEPLPHARQEVVGGDYFKVLQIPLVAGRPFTDGDTAETEPVVIVDQVLVDRYFRGQDPLGGRIRRGRDAAAHTIVGVVATINAIDLGEPVTKERIYYPVTQAPIASMGLVVKTTLDPLALVGQVRGVVEGIDPEQAIYDVRTLDQWVSRSLSGRRTPTVLLALFGGVALVLCAIGIYGVLSFAVSLRAREFAIRQALGADRGAIIRLVLGHGLRTAGLGGLLGAGGALLTTQYLRGLLYGTESVDAGTACGVMAILAGVAVLACLVPARRATRSDPMALLRDV